MQLKSVYRILLPAIAAVSLFAQPPATPKVTTIMATLTVKEGVTRDQIMKVMQSEVRDTVALYLDGKIQQWYARGDGKGVLEKLPLIKSEFASFDYVPLGPLSPLRLLIAPPAK